MPPRARPEAARPTRSSLSSLFWQERSAFFQLLSESAERPFLLVIIKGVGEAQRPPAHVPSVHYGLHYYLGKEKHPRVIEAHACLIRPAATGSATGSAALPASVCTGAGDDGTPPTVPPKAPHEVTGDLLGGEFTPPADYDPDHPDSWVLCTFAAISRRCRTQGLRTGTTELEEEK